MDCTLLAKVDWQSGKVAADDDGIFSPRLKGPLYVIGTRWLAEGALNPVLDTPVTGTLELPDGTQTIESVDICNLPLDHLCV